MGVDTPLMMTTLRAMATATGNAPEILEMLADAAIERPQSQYLSGLLQRQHPRNGERAPGSHRQPQCPHPAPEKGAKMLYVALAGAHTILPAAAIFETVGEDWTLSIFEAANYGVFLGDTTRAKEIAKRIVDEAKELGVEEIVISECGHAYYAMRWTAPNWFGDDFNFRVRSIVEVLAEYIQQNRLKLDPSANPEPITYHDSCNLARKGGVIEEPRLVLRAVSTHYRD